VYIFRAERGQVSEAKPIGVRLIKPRTPLSIIQVVYRAVVITILVIRGTGFGFIGSLLWVLTKEAVCNTTVVLGTGDARA